MDKTAPCIMINYIYSLTNARTIKSSINYELKLHHKKPKVYNIFLCHKNGCVPDTQNGIKYHKKHQQSIWKINMRRKHLK